MTTTATATEQPKAVESTLNFWLDPALGGHSSYQTGTAGYYRRKFDEHAVEIQNIRGRENDFSLNTHGFEYRKHTSVEDSFDDEAHIKSVVYPETEEFLKKVTGATRVYTFSHIVRKTSREEVEAKVNTDPALQDDEVVISSVTPARFIHIDFSYDGALEILKDNFPSELGQKLSKSRWAIINVWRPIKPISKDPLALCDAFSVKDEDLKPITVKLPPKGTGQYSTNVSQGNGFELYYLKHNPEQRWYYVDSMAPGEVLLLKCYDSIRDGKTATRVPHSSFTNPRTKDDANRESIEIRCFVFYEDQPVNE